MNSVWTDHYQRPLLTVCLYPRGAEGWEKLQQRPLITNLPLCVKFGTKLMGIRIGLNWQKTLKWLPDKTIMIYRYFDDFKTYLHWQNFSACLDLGGTEVIFAQNWYFELIFFSDNLVMKKLDLEVWESIFCPKMSKNRQKITIGIILISSYRSVIEQKSWFLKPSNNK